MPPFATPHHPGKNSNYRKEVTRLNLDRDSGDASLKRFLSDAVTVHGVPLNPVCQEELYNPRRDVSINPNENSILTP